MRTDLIGRTFGLLTIRKMLPERKCICDCACGAKKLKKRYDHITSGLSSSCGCAKNALISLCNTRHGESRVSGNTAEFRAWTAMRARCSNLEDLAYGGRGIKVHPDFLEYRAFLAHVGRRPSPGHQLDRIDNDGDYAPGNLKWSTRKDQCRNRRTTREVVAFGRTASLAEMAEIALASAGLEYGTILARLNAGWDAERALTESAKRRNKNGV